MKKLFNSRPFFIVALSFALGIVSGLFSMTSPVVFYIIASIVGAAAVFCGAFLVYKSLGANRATDNAASLGAKRTTDNAASTSNETATAVEPSLGAKTATAAKPSLGARRALTVLLCCLFVALGFFAFFAEIKTRENAYLDTTASIEGIITDKFYEEGNKTSLILRDVKITVSGKQYNLKGYTSCVVPSKDLPNEINAGDKVGMTGQIFGADLFVDGTVFTYYYKNNIRYIIGDCAVTKYSLNGDSPSLTEGIRGKCKSIIYGQVGSGGGTLYALMFGDKTDMDKDMQTAFQTGGIIHVFAVSGLHVGFLATALFWLFEKLKINKNGSFIAATAIFILYAALCDFSPSVMRAVIMAIVVRLSVLSGRKYDLLSSMGLSAMIILLFRPLMLFDIGFLLSFGCVFGIAVFMPSFSKLFSGLPTFLRTSLAMSFSVQIAILPLLASFFGTVSLFATLLNLIAIPLITAAFFALFTIVLLSAVFGFLAPLLLVPNFIVAALYYCSNLALSTGIATIVLTSFGLLAGGFFLTMYLGRYLLIDRNKKTAVCLVMCLLFLTATLFTNLPKKNPSIKGTDSITAIQSEEGYAAILTTKENNVYLVLANGDKPLVDELFAVTDYFSIKAFDALIFFDVSPSAVAVFDEIADSFYFGTIIMPYHSSISPQELSYHTQIISYGINTLYTDDINKLNSFEYRDISISYFAEGMPLSMSLNYSGISILFLYDLEDNMLEYVFTFVPFTPTVVFTDNNLNDIMQHFNNALVIFRNKSYNYFDPPSSNSHTESDENSLTLTISGGKIGKLSG